jgi:myo-inositol-1(or 4)-monophosphatase
MIYSKISEIMKNAGKLALSYFLHPHKQRARLKEDDTIVTEADIETQKYLVTKLKEITPDYTIVGEENSSNLSEKDINELKNTKYIWAIDPIDGTASFSNDLPNWVISLGLLVDGEPKGGWIYAPVWNQMFYTFPEEDWAYLNGEKLDKLDFSNGLNIKENTCIMIDSKTFRKYYLENYEGKVRSFGSTAFHITLVASGKVIAANSIRNKIWDIVAASAIANKCNVHLHYYSGRKVDYRELLNLKHTKEDIITCNDTIFSGIKSFFVPLNHK